MIGSDDFMDIPLKLLDKFSIELFWLQGHECDRNVDVVDLSLRKKRKLKYLSKLHRNARN